MDAKILNTYLCNTVHNKKSNLHVRYFYLNIEKKKMKTKQLGNEKCARMQIVIVFAKTQIL